MLSDSVDICGDGNDICGDGNNICANEDIMCASETVVELMDTEMSTFENFCATEKSNHVEDIKKLSVNIKKNTNVSVNLCARDFFKKWSIEYNVTQIATNSMLSFMNNFFPSLPIDARTLLKSMRKVATRVVHPGIYAHCGIRKGVENILNNTTMVPLKLKLDIFKNSSESSCWVITGRICELNSEVFLIGIYLGKTQPTDSSEYLRMYVDLYKLLKNDYIYNSRTIELSERLYICDSPGRSDILGVRQHNARNGCNKCMVEGRHIDGRMIFYPVPDNVIKRTNGILEVELMFSTIGLILH